MEHFYINPHFNKIANLALHSGGKKSLEIIRSLLETQNPMATGACI